MTTLIEWWCKNMFSYRYFFYHY